MNKIYLWLVTFLCLGIVQHGFSQSSSENEWISLFDGESLHDWKVGENAETFSVVDGAIKIDGPRAHLYYVGDVKDHNFVNFEFQTQVMTRKGANSGVYFHTNYEDGGWPSTGYEVQVNNSAGDWKRTGSLYDILEVRETYAKDDEWFNLYIKVKEKRVIVKIDDITVVDYTEPKNPVREEGERQNRILTSGTFALQAHDPNSVILYKDIMVKPLPN